MKHFGTTNLLKEIIKHKPIQHKPRPIKQNSIEKAKKKEKIKKK